MELRDAPRLHGHTNHNVIWLIIGICGLSGLGWLINTQDPDFIVPLGAFFLLISVTAFSLTLFITNIVRRSVLVGGGVFVFFLLRFLGLRDLYYAVLLLACLISLEVYMQKR